MADFTDTRALAEALRESLTAKDGWPPRRRLDYLVLLGVKNRAARFTQAFGGEAAPEPDSIARLALASTEEQALVRALYLLERMGGEVVLDGQTARGITDGGHFSGLIEVLNAAIHRGYARRPDGELLSVAERNRIVQLELTDAGREYLCRAAQLAPAPVARSM